MNKGSKRAHAMRLFSNFLTVESKPRCMSVPIVHAKLPFAAAAMVSEACQDSDGVISTLLRI